MKPHYWDFQSNLTDDGTTPSAKSRLNAEQKIRPTWTHHTETQRPTSLTARCPGIGQSEASSNLEIPIQELL